MDPTQAELDAFNTVAEIATWLGIEGDTEDASTDLGSLLRLIGLRGDHHPRALAAIGTTDIEAVLAIWRVGEPAAAPTPALRAQAGELGRLARVRCGREPTFAEAERRRKQLEEVTLLQAQAAAQSAGAASGGSPKASPRKVKASQVINQMDEADLSILDPAALKRSYEIFTAKMGALPSHDHECTAEQVSALHSLASSGAPLYVDLAVWGPHHYRLLKKIKLSGMQIMPNGVLHNIELAGPPNFEMWEKCMTVFKTGCIQLELLSPARVEAYMNVIKSYNSRYSHGCWHLVYQADVRMRLEHAERVRRRGESEKANATAAGLHHDYVDKNPWEWVWSKMPEESRFWREELEEPCMLVLARTGSLQQMVQGDAPVANDSGQGSTGGTNDSSRGKKKHPASPSGFQKVHNVTEGIYTTNRRGLPLCQDFQRGMCDSIDANRRCRKNGNDVHQCNKCLCPDHGGRDCGKAPRMFSEGKGKKGKGKGRGKGKSRPQY